MQNSKTAWLILAALWLIVFVVSSQLMIIAPILPAIEKTFLISKTIQGGIVAAYALPLGILALLVGPVSDKIGRRRILFVGTGVMCAALLLHLFVYDYISLYVVRFLTGCAGGLLSGASIAYVADYFPPKKRGWASGVVMTGIASGFTLGIPLGTLIAYTIDFRYPFALFGLLLLVSVILIWKVLPQPEMQHQHQQLTLMHFVKKYQKILADDKLKVLGLCFFLMSFCVAIYVVFLPTWLVEYLGVTGSDIALLMFIAGLGSILVSWHAGRLSDRLGRKDFVVYSCLGLSIVIGTTTIIVVHWWIAYPLVAIAMMLDAARVGPFHAMMTDIVPEDIRGTMISTSIAMGQMGMAIGGMIAGFCYHNVGFFLNTIMGALAVLSVGILIAVKIPESLQISKKETNSTIKVFEKLPNNQVIIWKKQSAGDH
jgi:predicted MFS family arabinose efflux permease